MIYFTNGNNWNKNDFMKYVFSLFTKALNSTRDEYSWESSICHSSISVDKIKNNGPSCQAIFFEIHISHHKSIPALLKSSQALNEKTDTLLGI